MAKRNSTRRAARKPKLINVEGHQLTEEMYARYEQCLQDRGRILGTSDTGRVLEMGLDDFLSRYRPSAKISRQLLDITQETLALSIAIGAMKDYSWRSIAATESIRAGGIDLVKKLALELYNASAKLTSIAMSVESEDTTKLQDWLAWDKRIADIGRGAKVTRG
jgi:hypothetical protein